MNNDIFSLEGRLSREIRWLRFLETAYDTEDALKLIPNQKLLVADLAKRLIDQEKIIGGTQ